MIDPKTDAVRRLAEAGIDNPRLDVRVLWDHSQRSPAVFEQLVTRRLTREPLAYITGHKEFWSLEFRVGPGVLVPRPETETIIEQTMAFFPNPAVKLRVLDFGTGSGCLLVAFLKEFPNSSGLGIDYSEEAIRIATANIAEHGLKDRAEIRLGNWDENTDGKWDVILSNPPYIRGDDLRALEPEVAQYEPRSALDGGPDGLAAIRQLATAMARRLTGYGFVEIGAGQATEASTIMVENGLEVVHVAPDLAGTPRVLVTKPAGRD